MRRELGDLEADMSTRDPACCDENGSRAEDIFCRRAIQEGGSLVQRTVASEHMDHAGCENILDRLIDDAIPAAKETSNLHFVIRARM